MDLVEEVVPLADRELAVLRPRNSEALLDEHAFEEDEFMPYWAELWPSGVALARAIARRALKGATVLELGCGLGLPSIAAALAGGRVLATDWSSDAVKATAANAAMNEVRLETERVAWGAPDAIVERAPWPYVIASDVLYEPRNVDALLELLPLLVDRKSRVLLADPGRSPAKEFLERAAAGRWHVRTTGSSRSPRVSIHRLRLR
jgi:predicted nicotinamide N-methyase